MCKKIIIRFYFIILLLCITNLSAQSQNADWSTYQYNPQHTGYNDQSSISLPFQLKWVKTFSDWSFQLNPVTLKDDYVIVTSGYEQTDTTCFIRCLSANDGSLVWEHYFNSVYSIDQATCDGNNVYVSLDNFWGSYVFSYRLDNGIENWRQHFRSQGFITMGTVVHKDHVIFSSGTYGGLECANQQTGDSIWFERLYHVDNWIPAVHDSIVCIWLALGFKGIDLYTAEDLWLKAPYESNNNLNSLNESELFSEDALSKFKRTNTASSSIQGMNVAPVIDTNINMIYLAATLGAQGIFAYDFYSQELIWKYYKDSVAEGFYPKTPTIYNGNVIIQRRYDIICFDGLTGEEQWQYHGDDIYTNPAVIGNGILFTSSDSSTIAIDLETQELLWSYDVGGKLTLNDDLYIATPTGELYCFGDITTSIGNNNEIALPKSIELKQNYPNPFNPSTEIEFSLTQKSFVTIEIINITGQKVRILSNQEYSTGNHTVTWDGKDDNGNQLSSGIYLYRLKTDDITLRKKMVLLK